MLGASLIFGGCSAAKKPVTPTPGAPITPKAVTPAENEDKKIADRVTAEAKKVKEVRGAVAVVSGKNIYLGLDLDPNIEKSKRAEVEKTVLDQVKKMEPNHNISYLRY